MFRAQQYVMHFATGLWRKAIWTEKKDILGFDGTFHDFAVAYYLYKQGLRKPYYDVFKQSF